MAQLVVDIRWSGANSRKVRGLDIRLSRNLSYTVVEIDTEDHESMQEPGPGKTYLRSFLN